MNIHQLEYIVAVDQHRHFAQAAEACHVTQATLSAMIKKLEQELNIKLFDRTRQPVKTTEDGQQVIELAKKMLFYRNQILDLNAKSPEQLGSSITLGIIPTVANSLLPMILPKLLKSHPNLQLKIVEITTDEIRQQLLSGKIDMGIMATPVEDDQIEENILYYEAMMVYGVTESHKKYVHKEDIRGKRIWLLEEGNCFRDQSMTICNVREKEGRPGNLTFEGSSFDTLLNLTDQFGGYTLVPELYFNLMPEKRKKKTRHFELPYPVREISLVYHRPYVKRRSIEILTKEIKDLVSRKLITCNLKPMDMSITGI